MDEISTDNKYYKEAVSLTTWDVVAVVLYFVTILSVGISVSILMSHLTFMLIYIRTKYESHRRGTFIFRKLIPRLLIYYNNLIS